MRILILFPIILYLWIVIFNLDMLKKVDSINIYWITNIDIPVFLYISIFSILYVVFVILLFDSVWIFSSRKIKKLNKEVFELKSKLYDEREDELIVFLTEQRQRVENFIKKQESLIEDLKLENNNSLKEQKADTDRILDKFWLLEEWILDKIKKTFKSKK